MKPKEVCIQRFINEDGLPKANGMYFTDRGRLAFYIDFKQWMKHNLNGETIVEPEWWLELMPESKYLEGILPLEVVDETFIEHHISYQHHGVVRMAINKYKKWLLGRLLDEDKDYKR